MILTHHSVLQKVKSAVTTALQGERSSTVSINGGANGQAHANGNGNTVSSYTVSKEMKYESVKQEIVEDVGEQESFQVSEVSVA